MQPSESTQEPRRADKQTVQYRTLLTFGVAGIIAVILVEVFYFSLIRQSNNAWQYYGLFINNAVLGLAILVGTFLLWRTKNISLTAWIFIGSVNLTFTAATITPLPDGKKIKRRKPWLQDWIEAILFAFVVAMIIRNYTFQNFVIPSSSMEKTLLVGDYLVANKLKYFFKDPQREDIVTFRYPKIGEGTPEHPKSKDDFVRLFHPLLS